MQKYFISEADYENNRITGDDAFHIKSVMRYKPGEEIIINYNKKNYLAVINEIGNNSVLYTIKKEQDGNVELPFFVAIYQGYPKGDKLDDIIKHGTELGVSEITPVIMERTIVKLDPSKIGNKTIRFNKIAKEAAEQSNRDYVPVIKDPVKLSNVDFSNYDIKILCYEETAKNGCNTGFKSLLKSLKSNMRICFVIGPEGGISPKEAEYLESKGFISVGLGSRILRTETVVFYVLSAISYETELE